MAFVGTQQKCKACDKTVYVVDQLSADGSVFHKACFRCHHCKGTLKLSNYSSYEGTLYCKPHFDQLFKLTGSLDKSFESTPKSSKASDLDSEGESRTPSKFSSAFAGTKEKCVACGKTVYPIEKISVDGMQYHKSCFKCCHAGCSLSHSNYITHEGRLYCRHHHAQLFRERGDFSQLEKMPAVRTVTPAED
ncbi:hypothetical protein KP509_12G046700 [Ceratopteris richardii]|uniref:LIM zinc-binding domain-containing protein n=1 Tax=Ceratopteris richardii TaxID=49495 RepID=A0A8T2TKQ6_CERRI|nr:hypothetical protein KP509_12G046700 [Ceratopteris richardii]